MLGILVAIAIYMGFTGGFNLGGGGDLPGMDTQQYLAESGLQATTPPPAASAPPPDAAPPSAAPGAPPPSSAGEIGMGGAPPSASPPSQPAPSAPSTPGQSSPGSMSINEKLLSFRNLDPDIIINDKYEVLEESVTEPEKFAADIGRVDPLTVVNQFIPPELRPPRQGETNDEKVLGFLEELTGHEILNQIRLDIVEVINAGNMVFVLIRFGPGEPTPVPVGSSYGFRYGGLNITVVIDSATRNKVVYRLIFQGEYSSGSRTVTAISPSY